MATQVQRNAVTFRMTDAYKSKVPIFRRINSKQRVRIEWPLRYPIHTQVTFIDENGVTKTIRYKENSNTIDFDKQVKEERIPENAPATTAEREALTFINGGLTTWKPTLIEYLKAYPLFAGFKGHRNGKKPMFFVEDLVQQEAEEAELYDLKIKAGSVILAMSFEKMKDTLLKIYGSFYHLPRTESGCKKELYLFLDEGIEAINYILEGSANIDDEMTILIGRLIDKGLLSFKENKDFVSMYRNGKWVDVKEISSAYDSEERRRYFTEFLLSKDGNLVLEEMKKLLGYENEDKKVSHTKKGQKEAVLQ